MPSRIYVKSVRSWGAQFTDPATGKAGGLIIPCGDLGEATPERVALLRKIIDVALAEGKAARVPGRPRSTAEAPAPAAASPDLLAMFSTLMAQNAALIQRLPLAGAAKIADEFPTEMPSVLVKRYLDSESARIAGSTLANTKCHMVRILDGLGGEAWGPWRDRFWDWLGSLRSRNGKKALSDGTKENISSTYAEFRSWAKRQGVTVPAPEGERVTLTVRERREAGQTGKAGKQGEGESFSVEEVRRILSALDGFDCPVWFPLAIKTAIFSGLIPEDIRTFLGDNHRTPPIQYAFIWKAEVPGVLFYESERAKTGEAYNLPLSPILTTAIRPYLTKDGKIDIGGVGEKNTFQKYFHALIERAGVKEVERQSWKRFRTFFQSTLDNDMHFGSGIRTRLMGHRRADKSEGSKASYTRGHDMETAQAIRSYQDFILETATAEGKVTA